LSDTARKTPDYPGKRQTTPENVRGTAAKRLLVLAQREPTKVFTNKVYKQGQYLYKGLQRPLVDNSHTRWFNPTPAAFGAHRMRETTSARLRRVNNTERKTLSR
jgi:hypothetical protein